jgi:hypothetical protein
LIEENTGKEDIKPTICHLERTIYSVSVADEEIDKMEGKGIETM